MNIKPVLYLLLVVALGCKKGSSPSPGPVVPPVKDTSFTNPLLSSGPDPWVIQKDSFYYYTHTGADRIRVWRTKAMSKLGAAEERTIWLRPAAGPNSQNVWAPELHFLDGKWYAYYTAGATLDHSTQRNFVLENAAADPFTGTWVDKGKIADAKADVFAIDATVFEHNNKRYFLYSGHASATDNSQQNIYIAEMANPWTLATERVKLSSPDHIWEVIGFAPGISPAVNEAPQMLKGPTGKVFLIYSAAGCWTDDYALGMLTLKDGGDPLRPADWVKSSQPVFVKKPLNNAFGPGHNAFFKSPDKTEDWIVYHANPSTGLGCTDRRNPRMQEFSWRPDGTPNFGEPAPLNSKLPRPSGEKD